MERYGVDPGEIDKQMRNFGLIQIIWILIDLNKFTYNSLKCTAINKNKDNKIDRNSDFYKKYSEKLKV